MYNLIVAELERKLKKITKDYYLLYIKTMYIYESLILKNNPMLKLEVLEIFYHLKEEKTTNIEGYIEKKCQNMHLKIFLIYILTIKLNENVDSKTILNNIKTKYGNMPEYQNFNLNLKKIITLLNVEISDIEKIAKLPYSIHVNKFISDYTFDFLDINFIGTPPKEVIQNSFNEIIVRICVSGGVLYQQEINKYIFLEKGDVLISNQLFFNKISVLTLQCNILVYKIKSKILMDILNKKIKANSAKKIKISQFEKVLNEINSNQNSQDLLISKLLLDIIYYYDAGDNNYDLKFLNDFNFVKILEYIDLNLEKKITVKDLEKNFNTYNNALIKLFLNNLGVLPSDYLFKQRLIRAAILLRTTSYRINHISEMLSFSSSSNFSIAFKTFFGITPLRYRAEEESQKLETILN